VLLPPSVQTRKYLDICAKQLLEGKAASLKHLELLKLMFLPPAACQKTGICVAGQSHHFYIDCEGMRILVVSAPADNATPIQAFVCDLKHKDTKFY